MSKPDPGARVLIYDIETAPNLGYTWGKWDQNVIEFKDQWHILSVAWKWLGDKKGHVRALPDYPETYAANPNDDGALAELLQVLFDDADVTVTHNGVTFDKPKAQTRMIFHGLQPPSPHKEIDTLKVARRTFKFTSNRLGDLCEYLGLPHKADPGGFQTWLGCLNGDPKAWKTMAEYNLRDVEVLEKLYLRFLPWIQNHPNLAVIGDRPAACPRCGAEGRMQARGWHYHTVTKRRQYQCQACKGYCAGRKTQRVPSEYVSV